MTLLTCHMLVTSAGFMFAEIEFKSFGSNQLLDELEEGLIILGYDLGVLYHNKAIDSIISIICTDG